MHVKNLAKSVETYHFGRKINQIRLRRTQLASHERRYTLPPMFRHLETKRGGDYVTDCIP